MLHMITTNNKSINFIKKEDLTGSYNGMRYIMQHKKDTFVATIWPEPLCFEKTPDEEKTSKEFPLTEEGRNEAIAWLNQCYEAEKSRWDRAKASFYQAFHKQ